MPAISPLAKMSRSRLDRELVRVASEGGPGQLQRLLDQGADPLACPKPARHSALHAAAQRGRCAEVRLLAPLSDLRSRDNLGHTPLMWAAISDHPETCLALRIPGHPSLDDVDKRGRTALALAASCGSLRALHCLAGHCRADICDDEGSDPLMLAFLHRNISCALALIPFCDPRRQRLDGLSLASLASQDAPEPALAPLLAAIRARCEQLRLEEETPPATAQKSKAL